MTRFQGIIVGVAVFLATAAVHAQPPGPPPPPAPLDAAGRTAVVSAAADALRQRYVYPDVGRRAAEAIEAALAAGKYDEIVQPWAFAERLTADLQEVAHDKHMRVTARGRSRPAAARAARRRARRRAARPASRAPTDCRATSAISRSSPCRGSTHSSRR